MKKEKSRPIVKIFVAYHKPGTLLKSEVFVPIHVGRASLAATKDGTKDVAEERWLRSNMIGDDTGENISVKNPFFCELTAHYWAWKNLPAIGNPQYVGFFHYRRHLSFRTNKVFSENRFGLIDEPALTDEYLEKYGLLDENIRSVVKEFDIVTVKPWDTRHVGSENNYEHYKSSDEKLHIRDYELALRILKELYPNFSKAGEIYNKNPLGYYTNIFVMKASVFCEYCEWLFSILFRLEKRIDISDYSPQEARVFGYISEWLFGIFLTRKKIEGTLKIKELQRTIVHESASLVALPSRKTPLHFSVCFASDDRYAPHLGTAIASLLKNKNPNDTIDVYVLDGGISQRNKGKLDAVSRRGNLELKYISIRKDGYGVLPMPANAPAHISVATYLRLFLPKVLPSLDKIIYLDCDLLVVGDLSELWATDISKHYMGGVVDMLEKENCERLSLRKYCNAGVLLLNLKKIREDGMQERFFQFISDWPEKIIYHDQDVLNVVLQEGILYLDPKWNAQTGEYPLCYSSGINAAAKYASVIHFIGEKKPWDAINEQPFRELYFEYRRNTPWRNSACGAFPILKARAKAFLFEESFGKDFVRVKLFGIRVLKTPLIHRRKDSPARKIFVRALAALFFPGADARRRFRARHLNLDPRFKK